MIFIVRLVSFLYVSIRRRVVGRSEWQRLPYEFKEFLEGEPGETITMEFTGGKDASSDVSSDLEKVSKFKLKITN